MKFRVKWNKYKEGWDLQTPPCTSSGWDTHSAHIYKWQAKATAWLLAKAQARKDKLIEKNQTEEFEYE